MRLASILTATIAVSAGLNATLTAGGDALARARAVFAAAHYEQALRLFETIPASRDVHYYRAVCLLALGRIAEAEAQLNAMIALDPLVMPDPDKMSPRMVAKYIQLRRVVLPQIARDTFREARALLRRGDRDAARGRFERTIEILDTVTLEEASTTLEEGSTSADLRDAAAAFLDLTTGAAAPATKAVDSALGDVEPARTLPASSTSVAAESTRHITRIFTPPIPIVEKLPTWRPRGTAALHTFRGEVRLEIDESGQVVAASIEKSAHPSYDRLVLDAARTWLYKPATLDGVPVVSEKSVEILLRPLQ